MHFVITGEMKDMGQCVNSSVDTAGMVESLSNLIDNLYNKSTNESVRTALTQDFRAINEFAAKWFKHCGVSREVIYLLEQVNLHLQYAEYSYSEEVIT